MLRKTLCVFLKVFFLGPLGAENVKKNVAPEERNTLKKRLPTIAKQYYLETKHVGKNNKNKKKNVGKNEWGQKQTSEKKQKALTFCFTLSGYVCVNNTASY